MEKSILNNFDKDDNFFIIDSFNLEQIQTKLYGFCIQGEDIIKNSDVLNEDVTGTDGAFIYIKRSNETITIKQDFTGAYGLYLFQKGKYFAISNSFFYLLEYLKDKYKLTFNKDYANTFVITRLCSLSYSQTMVNEIKMLERNSVVNIDIKTKKIKISYIDYLENTVNLDSEEGMKILDDWYTRQIKIIKNLKSQNKPAADEVTGGYDSRITFGLVKNSGVNLNDLYMTSRDTEILHEDFQYAANLAKKYGFTLNNEKVRGKINYNYSPEDNFNMIFYSGGNRHSLIYTNDCNREEYIFTGYYGECIRAFWEMTDKDFIEKREKWCDYFSSELAKEMKKSVKKVLGDTFNSIIKKFNGFNRKINPFDLPSFLFRETEVRNHFGPLVVQNYLCGKIRLAPSGDAKLHKLALYNDKCRDKSLLSAIFYVRYNKDLLDIPFTENKKIDTEIIKYAQEINNKYPLNFSSESFNIKSKPENKKEDKNNSYNEIKPFDEAVFSDFIKNIYYNENSKNIFCSKMSEELYNKLGEDINKNVRHPLRGVSTFISIYKTIQYCNDSQKNGFWEKISK